MATVQKTSVILSSSADWEEWLEIVKTKALSGEVWDYVNPQTPKAILPALTQPVIPRPADVKDSATRLLELDIDEKEELSLLRYDYKHRLATYDRQ